MTTLANGLTDEIRKNLFGDADLNMLWSCVGDPRFCYWVHVPSSYNEYNETYGLMVIVHGTGCATENYVREARTWCDEHHFAVLAPMFPSGIIDHNDFNAYKLLNCDGIRYDYVLLDMVKEMKDRYSRIDADKFFLFGHSGGGQYVERFLLAHPEKLKAVSIGAPGRPTFIDPDTDYFWGTRNFREIFDKDLDLDRIREVPVQITVGEKDVKFIGESPYGNCRVERMKSLQKNFLEHGVRTVELEILPGLEHADGGDVRVHTAQHFFERYL